MKTMILSLMAVVTIASPLAWSGGVGGTGDIGSGSDSLLLSCSLDRFFVDKDGEAKHINITPNEPAIQRPVRISHVQNGEIPGTRINFSVQTPNGLISVDGSAFATDEFGQSYSVNISASLNLVDKDVALPAPDLGNSVRVKYSDKELPEIKSTTMAILDKNTKGKSAGSYTAECVVIKMK